MNGLHDVHGEGGGGGGARWQDISSNILKD